MREGNGQGEPVGSYSFNCEIDMAKDPAVIAFKTQSKLFNAQTKLSKRPIQLSMLILSVLAVVFPAYYAVRSMAGMIPISWGIPSDRVMVTASSEILQFIAIHGGVFRQPTEIEKWAAFTAQVSVDAALLPDDSGSPTLALTAIIYLCAISIAAGVAKWRHTRYTVMEKWFSLPPAVGTSMSAPLNEGRTQNDPADRHESLRKAHTSLRCEVALIVGVALMTMAFLFDKKLHDREAYHTLKKSYDSVVASKTMLQSVIIRDSMNLQRTQQELAAIAATGHVDTTKLNKVLSRLKQASADQNRTLAIISALDSSRTSTIGMLQAIRVATERIDVNTQRSVEYLARQAPKPGDRPLDSAVAQPIIPALPDSARTAAKSAALNGV